MASRTWYQDDSRLRLNSISHDTKDTREAFDGKKYHETTQLTEGEKISV